MNDRSRIRPNSEYDRMYSSRSLSELGVDIHIYVVPLQLWREQLRSADSQSVLDEAVSGGFIRVMPDSTVTSLRIDVENQLGYDNIPRDFVFLKCVGRCFTVIKPKQESSLKAKNFIPPQTSAPEMFVIELTDDIRSVLVSSGSHCESSQRLENGVRHKNSRKHAAIPSTSVISSDISSSSSDELDNDKDSRPPSSVSQHFHRDLTVTLPSVVQSSGDRVLYPNSKHTQTTDEEEKEEQNPKSQSKSTKEKDEERKREMLRRLAIEQQREEMRKMEEMAKREELKKREALKLREEEERRRMQEQEMQQKNEEELKRKFENERRKLLMEEKLRREQEERKTKEEEIARINNQEQLRKEQEEELRRQPDIQRTQSLKEMARNRKEHEEDLGREEDEQRKKQEEEQRKIQEEEQRKKQEEEQRKKQQEEEQHIKEELQKREEEEQKKKRELQRNKAEELQKKEAEKKMKQEELMRKKLLEEKKKQDEMEREKRLMERLKKEKEKLEENKRKEEEARREAERAALLREIEQMKEERRKQEEKQEELIKKVEILQEESRLNHSDVKGRWKKKFIEERKKTPALESECNQLKKELDIINKKILSNVETSSRFVTHGGNQKPSEKSNLKIQALRLRMEIEELKGRLDNLQMKLTTESKLRMQAEEELQSFRPHATRPRATKVVKK